MSQQTSAADALWLLINTVIAVVAYRAGMRVEDRRLRQVVYGVAVVFAGLIVITIMRYVVVTVTLIMRRL